ncbi:MAG: hypothetical protein J7F05_17315, partial [Trichodesmium erythraeum GBRTRLIN201]|nr:hypothetical protein [Trichodesmium erythraeum GBRTRLIN201]
SSFRLSFFSPKLFPNNSNNYLIESMGGFLLLTSPSKAIHHSFAPHQAPNLRYTSKNSSFIIVDYSLPIV